MPHRRRARAATWAGACLVLLALTLGTLLLLQPWASCPDDDVPAACPVPAAEVPLHAVGWVGAAVAGAVGAALLVRPPRTRPSPG